MRVGIQRVIGAAAVGGVLSAMVMVGAAPPASAQTGDGGQVADAPTLSLTSLGADSDLALYGFQAAQTVTVPVPKGLTPSALTADLELPPYVGGGTLIVTQDNRTLSRVELLATDTTPITIPLTGARVVNDAVTFTVGSRLLPEEGECLYNPLVPLQLTDAAIAYTGKEIAPDVVADFLPSVLQRMTIFIPRKPTIAESDAAVKLTTAVVSRYGKQNTDVDVAPLADNGVAPASKPLERNVVIREKGDAAASLQGSTSGVPALVITGEGGDLANQVSMLTDALSEFALAPKAVAGPTTSSATPQPTDATLRDLGQPGVSATAFKPNVVVGVDQTELGRPVRDVHVQLKGSYTPLPSTVGGQVVVSIGDEPVDRWATDSTGVIDRSIDIPNSALTRDTQLSVAIEIAGNTGQCGEFQPVTLRIDDSTTVSGSPVKPTEPVGFQSIPQALMPRADVGVERGSFDGTARAVAIVEGLQRLSGPRIDTDVVSLQDAIDSDVPAVLVSDGNWRSDKVLPPVRAAADGKLDVERAGGGGTASLTLDPDLRFASLQVGRVGNRTVLFATSQNAPKELDSLLAWLDSDARRWSLLQGTALIAQPGHDPVDVNAETVQPPASQTGTSALWWVAVGVGVVIACAVSALMLRRRRT
jgi:hypothetical protein